MPGGVVAWLVAAVVLVGDVRRDREEADVVSRALDWLIAVDRAALGRRSRERAAEEQRIVPPGAPDRRAETVVLLLFSAATVCAVGFIVGLRARPDRPRRRSTSGSRSGSRSPSSPRRAS